MSNDGNRNSNRNHEDNGHGTDWSLFEDAVALIAERAERRKKLQSAPSELLKSNKGTRKSKRWLDGANQARQAEWATDGRDAPVWFGFSREDRRLVAQWRERGRFYATDGNDEMMQENQRLLNDMLQQRRVDEAVLNARVSLGHNFRLEHLINTQAID